MKFSDFAKIIESLNITDDFEVNVIGLHSGSFGTIKNIKTIITNTPDGLYKELQLFIGA